jgi:acyl transferase domain-containing protein
MTEPTDSMDIAVIGLSCRFPGDAKSPDEFFEMLLNARSAWTEVPKDRFDIDSYWHPSHDRHGSMVGRGGHFLAEDVGLFDAPVSWKSYNRRKFVRELANSD